MKTLNEVLKGYKYDVLKGYKYDKEMEIDWMRDFTVYALNLSTMQFESTSGLGPRFAIYLNIYNNAIDYSEDIADKARKENADFLLYNTDHWTIGYVKINYRDHELYEGEVVYDVDMGQYGVITKLDGDKAELDMEAKPKDNDLPIGWCKMKNVEICEPEMVYGHEKWVCDRLDSLYQIAWGVTDTRLNNIVCFEHNHMEDGYPYYSPTLDENLFSFEVDER